MSRKILRYGIGMLTATVALWGVHATPVQAQDAPKPNILVIMGDDVGWFNIGAYHRGIMSGKTPNLDKLASRWHDVHRLLCRGELHGRPGKLHHRRNSACARA